jgi:hypothetical protein
MLTWKPRARRDACLRTTARCSTRSAATSPDQGCDERALARPDVEDELAGADRGLRDDPRGPLMIEPVPSPGPA